MSGPPTALRIGALLCLLLLTDIMPASSLDVLPFSPGQTVTLICAEEINITEKLTLITWRKENRSHHLYYASDGNKTESNFTDPRISFLSALRPLVLQIRDARPDDTGNYTCQITHPLGIIPPKSWTLQISGSSPLNDIYIYSSVAGAFLIFVFIAGIIYCVCCKKRNTIPSQIHQTSAENNVKEEPVYDNAHEDYFLRFNTLYDTAQVNRTAPRPDNTQ